MSAFEDFAREVYERLVEIDDALLIGSVQEVFQRISFDVYTDWMARKPSELAEVMAELNSPEARSERFAALRLAMKRRKWS